MTLSSPREGLQKPLPLQLRAHLRVDREEVERPVRPADNVMQAFLWRHLVPAREFAVTVQGQGRWIPVVALAEDDPVRVPRGGKARARFDVVGRIPVQDLRFEAIEPPQGVTLGEAKPTGRGGFTLEIKADRTAERTGTAENLIVEVFVEREVRPRKAEREKERPKGRKGRGPTQRYSLGFLPAIPIVIRRG